MSNYAATAAYVPEGVNRGNKFLVKVTVPTVLANADTLTVTLPDNVPKDALPVSPVPACYALSSDTYTRTANIGAVTTHNRSTGVTVLTATGAVTAGSIVLLEYLGIG